MEREVRRGKEGWREREREGREEREREVKRKGEVGFDDSKMKRKRERKCKGD